MMHLILQPSVTTADLSFFCKVVFMTVLVRYSDINAVKKRLTVSLLCHWLHGVYIAHEGSEFSV
jgi:hypothetical protein